MRGGLCTCEKLRTARPARGAARLQSKRSPAGTGRRARESPVHTARSVNRGTAVGPLRAFGGTEERSAEEALKRRGAWVGRGAVATGGDPGV